MGVYTVYSICKALGRGEGLGGELKALFTPAGFLAFFSTVHCRVCVQLLTTDCSKQKESLPLPPNITGREGGGVARGEGGRGGGGKWGGGDPDSGHAHSGSRY